MSPQPRPDSSTRIGPGHLRSAWVEFLDRVSFTYFHSHTFDRRRDIHPESIRKRVQLYCRRANDGLFGAKRDLAKNPGFGMVYAFEPHRDNRLHWHGLSFHPDLAADDTATRHLLNNYWNVGRYAHRDGLQEGFARVLPCQIKASAYVSKYVIKGGDIWIDDVLAWWIGNTQMPLIEVANGRP